MNRKLIVGVLLGSLLLLGLPASAHSVAYTARESGALECGNPAPQPATTNIYADGHHRHKVGGTSVYVHYSVNGVKAISRVDNWSVILSSVTLYNQTGSSYSWSSSYWVCT